MKLLSHRSSKFFIPIFLLLLLLVPSGIGQAQTVEEDGLTMTVRAGFDGISKSEAWFPVLITLANDGQPLDGTLEISMGDTDTKWITEVSLPTQSRKQIRATIFSNGAIRPVRVVLKNGSGEQVLAYSTGSFKQLDKEDSLVYAVVSPEPGTLELLEKVTNGRSDAAVAYVTLDELPEDPTAMQMLDVLVFTDIDTNPLSAAQRETIDTWVASGGQLVLTGGAGWQKTTAAFREQLPVEVSGTQSADDLSAFESDVGIDFRDPGPYVIAQSSLKNGELVWRNDSLPVLARRSVGEGNVWFLALDPRFAPLDDWDGSRFVWDSVAQHVSQPLFWERGFQDQNALNEAVSTIPEIQLPSVWLLLGFMGLYILIVGPLNYIILSRSERRELAWISLPATMLIFSVIAFLIGLQFRGNRVIINQLSVVTGRADATQLDVQTGIGIYSPRRDEFNIIFEPDTHLRFFDRFGFGGFSDQPEVVLGNENQLQDLLVDVGAITTLTADSFRPASPITGSAQLSADGSEVEVTVTNVSDTTLENVLLLVGTKQIALFDISRGETVNRTISIPSISVNRFAFEQATGIDTPEEIPGSIDTYQDSPLDNGFSTLIDGEDPGGYYQSYGAPPEQYQRYQLLSSLYETYNSGSVFMPGSKVILVGWDDTAQIDISMDENRYDIAASSLYFLEVPLEN